MQKYRQMVTDVRIAHVCDVFIWNESEIDMRFLPLRVAFSLTDFDLWCDDLHV